MRQKSPDVQGGQRDRTGSRPKRTAAMELRVGNRYRLGRKIGSGSFGDIYLGKERGSLGSYPGGGLWRTAGPGWAPLSCPFPALRERPAGPHLTLVELR